MRIAALFDSLDPEFRKMLTASCIFHVLLFGSVAVYGKLGTRGDVFFAPVYKVNLVSLPGEGERAGEKAGPASESKEGGAKLVEADRQKAIKEALESTKKTLAALKGVKGKGTEKEGKKVAAAKVGGKGGGGGPASGAAGMAGGPIMDPVMAEYYMKVKKKVEDSWSLPSAFFAPAVQWELRVGIRVDRDGQIEDSWLEKSSGNTYLDRSAMRAVKKSSPLPPIPSDISGDSLDLGLRFTSQELGR